MTIKKFVGEIIKIKDLSKTAKEVSIKLSDSIEFLPGSFMNVFIEKDGQKLRRAYSISSSSGVHDAIALCIRYSPNGTMTPLFWEKDMTGQMIELMGPMGLNTADKMTHKKIYLFAFGVGVGVVRSMADYFTNIKKVEHLTIYTGSRTIDEILYKEYFDNLKKTNSNISVKYIISTKSSDGSIPSGYIQDFIGDLDFNNSDIYVCGQDKACTDLVSKVKSLEPKDYNIFIESFH